MHLLKLGSVWVDPARIVYAVDRGVEGGGGITIYFGPPTSLESREILIRDGGDPVAREIPQFPAVQVADAPAGIDASRGYFASPYALSFSGPSAVRPRDVDRYGRTVAEVLLPDGRDLGRELVASGLAWHYIRYAPADGTLRRLQAEAKGERRGLWAEAGAVAPWDWRSGKGRGPELPAGSAVIDADGFAGGTVGTATPWGRGYGC